MAGQARLTRCHGLGPGPTPSRRNGGSSKGPRNSKRPTRPPNENETDGATIWSVIGCKAKRPVNARQVDALRFLHWLIRRWFHPGAIGSLGFSGRRKTLLRGAELPEMMPETKGIFNARESRGTFCFAVRRNQ